MQDFNEKDFLEAKYVFVIGMGGSILASKAVWNALSLHKKQNKKAFFLESLDERERQEIKDLISKKSLKAKDFVIFVVSKSGTTKETLETFDFVHNIFIKRFGEEINKRIITISSPNTPLQDLSLKSSMNSLEWEGDIGGRFSAFTIAHTLPLKILGLNTESFVKSKETFEVSWSKKLASEIFDYYKKGFNILDFFVFNSELEDLGKWARQLFAESIAFSTPTVSIGPSDLHSMLELYLGGPKVRFTVFVSATNEIDETINLSIYQKVTTSYLKSDLPFMKYEMEEINEKSIGEFMNFMISTVIELAKLMEVNPYTQEAVDNYKNNNL